MRIVCPECQFAQEIPTDKIPARAQLATCPRCKFKFRFRELDELPEDMAETAAPSAEETAHTSATQETADYDQSDSESYAEPYTEPYTEEDDQDMARDDEHYDDHYEDVPEETLPDAYARAEEDDLPPFPGQGEGKASGQDKDLWQALDDMAPENQGTEARPQKAVSPKPAAPKRPAPLAARKPQEESDSDLNGMDAMGDMDKGVSDDDGTLEPPSQRERMDAAQAYLKARQEQETPDRVVVDVPFECPEKYGFLVGLLKTYQRALFSPRLFFRVMPMNGYVKPIVFYIILSVVLIVFQMLWQKMGAMPVTDPITHEPIAVDTLSLAIFFQNILLFPVLSCSLMLGVSSLLHIFLSMLKGAAEGFEGTVRAMAYSSAPTIFMALPTFNQTGYAVVNAVALIWSMALTLVACKHIHRTSYPKVILALLLAMLTLSLLMAFFLIRGQVNSTI